jgi:hypothetical protein
MVMTDYEDKITLSVYEDVSLWIFPVIYALWENHV